MFHWQCFAYTMQMKPFGINIPLAPFIRGRHKQTPLSRGGRGCVRIHPQMHKWMPLTHPLIPSLEGKPTTQNHKKSTT